MYINSKSWKANNRYDQYLFSTSSLESDTLVTPSEEPTSHATSDWIVDNVDTAKPMHRMIAEPMSGASAEPMSRIHAALPSMNDVYSVFSGTIFPDQQNRVPTEVHVIADLPFQSILNHLQVLERKRLTDDAHRIFDERVSELFEIAREEGTSIDQSSLRDFHRFVDSFEFIKPGSLFLLDSGQLNVVWTDRGLTGRVSVVFSGSKSTRFAIIRRWNDGRKSRVSGTDSIHRVMRHVELNQLEGLLVP